MRFGGRPFVLVPDLSHRISPWEEWEADDYVEKTMQKFQQLAKDAQSNGDPVLAQNYLQHADHYLRRLNEISEKKDSNLEKNISSEDSNNQKISQSSS